MEPPDDPRPEPDERARAGELTALEWLTAAVDRRVLLEKQRSLTATSRVEVGL